MAFLIEAFSCKVGIGGAFLQDRVCGDHFPRNEVFPNAEVFERALGLRAPELVRRYLDRAEAVGFFSNVGHVSSPWSIFRLVSFCFPQCRELAGRKYPAVI